MHNERLIKVWDPMVRLFHWTLVSCFFTAYLTEGDSLNFHVWAGYTIIGLLCFRLVWGFLGPRYSRFSDFVYTPAKTLVYLKQVLQLRAERHLGHNPAGGAMIIALFFCLMATTASGLALYGADAWQGPLATLMQNTDEESIEWLEESHELFANLTLFLVLVHITGVIWESLLHRENLIRAMIDGRKRRETDPDPS